METCKKKLMPHYLKMLIKDISYLLTFLRVSIARKLVLSEVIIKGLIFSI